ncbi:hypothetical protein [Leptolyngbya ohadii]|uniref:hypothetical protein n=1 Tax=Leptolyngbya ohadii TaxID=1962290 RepID=UPI0015C58ED9|nr:hypothetical protein [Leptolyngbya ohadii]
MGRRANRPDLHPNRSPFANLLYPDLKRTAIEQIDLTVPQISVAIGSPYTEPIDG